MFRTSSLVLVVLLVALGACTGPEKVEDVMAAGERNVKLYARTTLQMNVDDPSFRMTSHPDNLGWKQYWAEASPFGDPEVKGWNEKVHTLYAFYLYAPSDGGPTASSRSVWVFTDRTDGQVVGHLKQGHRIDSLKR